MTTRGRHGWRTVVLLGLAPSLLVGLSASSCAGQSGDQEAAGRTVTDYLAMVDLQARTGGEVKLADFSRYMSDDLALTSSLDRLTFRENGFSQVGSLDVTLRDITVNDDSASVLTCVDVGSVDVQLNGRTLGDDAAPAVNTTSEAATQSEVGDKVGFEYTLSRGADGWLITKIADTTVAGCT